MLQKLQTELQKLPELQRLPGSAKPRELQNGRCNRTVGAVKLPRAREHSCQIYRASRASCKATELSELQSISELQSKAVRYAKLIMLQNRRSCKAVRSTEQSCQIYRAFGTVKLPELQKLPGAIKPGAVKLPEAATVRSCKTAGATEWKKLWKLQNNWSCKAT